ncbi:MAG: ATP-dependent DNA ligase [Candidatus Heimdallarchaeaceae archaeon]
MELCQSYYKLEKTQKKIEMVNILSETLKYASNEEIGKIALLTLGKLYPDFEGIELMLSDKLAVKALALATGRNEKTIFKILEEKGDIGETVHHFLEKKPQATLMAFTDQKEQKQFTVIEVWKVLDSIASTSGEGSTDKKVRILSGLITKVSPLESRYIIRMVIGQLRLGVATQLLLEALSLAKTGTRENKVYLERAYNRTSDIGFVAEILFKEGLESVKKVEVKLFNPIKVMLAQRVSSASDMLEKFGGECSLEYKYDGLRVQIHKKGKEVKLFSRRPENITNQFPDVQRYIIEAAKEEEFIIEGEIVAFDFARNKILPFQQVSQRKRKHDIEKKSLEIPVRVYLFDVLFCFGISTLDKNYLSRRKLLSKLIVPTENIKFSHQTLAHNVDEIEDFFLKALEDNCEGIMGKSIGKDSIYQAGARGWNWVKYKADYTDKLSDSFDLVILGADYGKGKRAGKYGTFLLGCFDEEEGVYRTFTRVATGFSDENLDFFFQKLKPLEREKPKNVISDISCSVWFEPEIVIEVSGAEITISQMHTCNRGMLENENDGLALRFPRFTGRIVEDKSAEESTSNEEIRTIYLNQKNKLDVY